MSAHRDGVDRVKVRALGSPINVAIASIVTVVRPGEEIRDNSCHVECSIFPTWMTSKTTMFLKLNTPDLPFDPRGVELHGPAAFVREDFNCCVGVTNHEEASGSRGRSAGGQRERL
jgi:hypothetical protein